MLAIHFENLLFLLFIGVAVLFQLLIRAVSKASKDSDKTKRRSTSTSPPIPRAPVESDEERIRKFLEALGQPTESKPPSPVVHRTDIPLRPVAPVRPPPSMTPFGGGRWLTPEERRKEIVILHGPEKPKTTPEPPRRVTLPRMITQIPVEPPERKPMVLDSPIFEVHASGTELPEPAPIARTPEEMYTRVTRQTAPDQQRKTDLDLAILLGSAEQLRQAIILREIFGPPRSLQPLELLGSV